MKIWVIEGQTKLWPNVYRRIEKGRRQSIGRAKNARDGGGGLKMAALDWAVRGKGVCFRLRRCPNERKDREEGCDQGLVEPIG
jgi:hypothetical protein